MSDILFATLAQLFYGFFVVGAFALVALLISAVLTSFSRSNTQTSKARLDRVISGGTE